VEFRLKRFEDALRSYDRALVLKPDDATVHVNRGAALNALDRLEAALESYAHALTLRPDSPDAYLNQGNVQRKLKRFEAALASYDRAVALRPDDALAHLNRGLALSALQRPQDAIESYQRALAVRPDFPDAYNNRGLALHDLRSFEWALLSYERALELKPDYADAYNNRGATLHELRRFDEALADYEHALRLDPAFAEAYLNRGNVFRERNRADAALDSYACAVQLKPDYAEAYSNLGQLLLELKRYDAAVESYERAVAANPGVDWLYGSLLHARMHLCAWQGIDSRIAELTKRIQEGQRATPPFPLLALVDSPAVQRHAAETWVSALFPTRTDLLLIAGGNPGAKIRLGYFSSDFHEHATTHLMAELFELHDRSRFELFAFSYGRNAPDEVTRRVSLAFDQFIDVRLRSDRDVAELSRQLHIDIAVDLKGHTRDGRVGIFAYRAAPVQVSYLGYPGTTGAPYIDYVIADRTLIRDACRLKYTEKICSLPDTYQVNDRLRQTDARTPVRKELGLPDKGFVFCCFNAVYKITPTVFDSWIRVLKQTEGSVLWLLSSDETAMTNLRREASARGLQSERLVFAPAMPIQQHLARHRVADLFLDTRPYNAHTTASDALWVGLPVITCVGESFASRVAASLLRATGLPELVTETPEQYETLAVALAASPKRLSEIRDRLIGNRNAAPLFDTPRFARHLEDAYGQMYARQRKGLAPEHIVVAD
jgi:predicted O-linked N-acetylglucosamine transferase (SPINDLY family)